MFALLSPKQVKYYHLLCKHQWNTKWAFPRKLHIFTREDIEDITRWREDMNFMFEWQEQYLTSERSKRVRYRVDHEKIKFISISGHVIFCLLYKHQWNTKPFYFTQRRDLLCNHNDGDLFTCEGMLSSRVKIWSFRGKAHLVFHWCLYNKFRY